MGEQTHTTGEKTGGASAPKRVAVSALVILLVALVIAAGVRLFADRSYIAVSACIALLACLPFFTAYERRRGGTRRMVVLAVMVVMAAAGRVLFSPVPAFKPVTAVVTVTGIYMGSEAGFLSGAMAALVSDLFFGLGPWTPFQMLTWGLIGLAAGLPHLRARMKKPPVYIAFGIVAAVFYSAVMNLWAVMSLDGDFSASVYAASSISSLPMTVLYMLSNTLFLLVMMRTVGQKLERLQIRHQIF